MRQKTFEGVDARRWPDACVADCPSRDVLSRLGERWAMLLLVRLKDEPMRFGELRRAVQGISQKMLTQTLRSLERDGLVSRRLLSQRPLAVEYKLTRRAQELIPIVVALKKWAELNVKAIAASNAAFDAAAK